MVTNIPLATRRKVIVLNVQALVFTIITIAKNFKGNALRVTAKVGCLIVTTHAPNLITTNPLNNNPRVVVKDMFNYIMEYNYHGTFKCPTCSRLNAFSIIR